MVLLLNYINNINRLKNILLHGMQQNRRSEKAFPIVKFIYLL